MSANWIVRRGNKLSTPISTAKLKDCINSGKIQGTDLVRREDQDEWHEARQIRGLLSPSSRLPSRMTPSVPPPPPPQTVPVVRRLQPSPVILEAPPPPPDMVERRSKACPFCGEAILLEARKCKHCGEMIDVVLRAAEEAKRAQSAKPVNHVIIQQPGRSNRGEKNKVVAALLAFFLGGLGIHKFYLGQSIQGILYLLFCWTFIPAIIAFLEGICYLTYSDEKFAKQYG